MTNRFLYRALTIGLLALGVSSIAPSPVRADDDVVTIVGCFLRMTDADGHHERYVLGNATIGAATAVEDQNCTASENEINVRLKDVKDVGLDQMASGRWLELYGELEHIGTAAPGSNHIKRSFEVKSFREVPLAPRIARALPPPAPIFERPAPDLAPLDEPAPVATSGTEPKELPKTASPMSLVALLGACAVAGGLLLSMIDRRRAVGRG